jgi:hypothetical protein
MIAMSRMSNTFGKRKAFVLSSGTTEGNSSSRKFGGYDLVGDDEGEPEPPQREVMPPAPSVRQADARAAAAMAPIGRGMGNTLPSWMTGGIGSSSSAIGVVGVGEEKKSKKTKKEKKSKKHRHHHRKSKKEKKSKKSKKRRKEESSSSESESDSDDDGSSSSQSDDGQFKSKEEAERIIAMLEAKRSKSKKSTKDIDK